MQAKPTTTPSSSPYPFDPTARRPGWAALAPALMLGLFAAACASNAPPVNPASAALGAAAAEETAATGAAAPAATGPETAATEPVGLAGGELPELSPAAAGEESEADLAPPNGETAPDEAAADEPVPNEPAPDEPADESVAAEDPAAAASSDLLEDSLEAFESSEVFWQQGSFEDAFAALDRAYELMAAVPVDGDPFIGQQKEDLRHLISRRVVEIYASRQTAVGSMNGSIPVVVNDEVKREIAAFQGRERDFFVESYRRSGLWRPMILEELRRAGLPEQISWLPLVESGFKVRALSRARALGLWQFIPSTGYRYGLQRNGWVDERMDPVKATRAAIGYLTDLHNLFGDWMTALAAYNCGEGTVLRQIQNQRVGYFDQFWDIYARLPRETRRYVPRFLATLAILEDPGAYGFALPEPQPAVGTEQMEVDKPIELAAVDRALGLDAGTLAGLNPELRHGATPEEAYSLRVPAGRGEIVLASVAELPKYVPPAARTTIHRVRRGETLSGVASRYGTSVRSLMNLNRLRSANRIFPGQQLQVPVGSSPSASRARSLAPGSEVTHRVRSGDSLWRLANLYGTTASRIRRDNGLTDNLLRPGQQLRILGPEAVSGNGGGSGGSGTYTVRSGDTLGAIARRHGVALGRLLAVNQLSPRSTIYPGQQLTIPD